MSQVEYISGTTFHGRRGAVKNGFRYSVDYVLLDMADAQGPSLFSRNKGNLTTVHDSDHGGAPKQGRGVAWVHEVLAEHDLPRADRVELLAQPRVLGHVFNPVSFWLCWQGDGLRVAIAEVSNTYGDRHCYLCYRDDLAPLTKEDHVSARKIFHVSPFQPIAGSYDFRFDIRSDRIGIWIDFSDGENARGGNGRGENGVIATLTGLRRPLTNRVILLACLSRPFGSRRVLALIHWQAVKLWWKGATFRSRPAPPVDEVTR